MTQRIVQVLAIGILFWSVDALLLVARGRGEAGFLQIVVALGVCSFVCIAAVLLLRRYALAMAAVTLLAVALVAVAVVGPTFPSKMMVGFMVIAAATAITAAALLPPERFVLLIPALLLLHHIVITRQMPGLTTIAVAIVLTPLMPPAYRFLTAHSRAVVIAGAISMAAAAASAASLRAHVSVRSWTHEPRMHSAAQGDNIVLIVLDTMRADRVGALGYRARPSTPFLNAFARQATVFASAYATTSWTIPSVASMFTGLTCGRHGLVSGENALPAARPTIAEVLRRKGYFTSGISANFALDDQTGFTRGFHRYEVLWRLVRGNRSAVPSMWDDLNTVLTTYYREWIALVPGWTWKPRATEVTERAIGAIDAAPRDTPMFLFVQYVDPHAPCDAVNDHAFRVADTDNRYDPKWSLEYDREVRDLDSALETLVDHIDRRLNPAKTLVIIVADHGEQLGEGGQRGHGKNLSEATIRVPLLVRFPGKAPAITTTTFSTARIFDLMTEAASVPAESQAPTFANSSLMLGDTLQRAVIDGRYKLVQRWQLAPEKLLGETMYMLPDETRDVLAGNAAVAGRLRIAAEADPLPRGAGGAMTEEMRAKLRALGYLR
jgi:phosphoglycerol transferase MdoB-like AlkP superfamily enzyme